MENKTFDAAKIAGTGSGRLKGDYKIGVAGVWVANWLYFLISAGAFLTPLASVNHPLFGKLLFMAYKPTCHQLGERSFFIAGHQMPLCARCTAIWASMAIIGTLLTIIMHIKKIPPINLFWFGVSLVPVAIDGTTQLIGLRESTNELRVITGIVAGIGVVLFTHPRLWNFETQEARLKYNSQNTPIDK
jgi:uncharacterized membrane protein